MRAGVTCLRMGAHLKDAQMKNPDPDQHTKRETAHALAARSHATVWPDWLRRAEPKRRKKVYWAKTPRFVLARAHKAGHGRYS